MWSNYSWCCECVCFFWGGVFDLLCIQPTTQTGFPGVNEEAGCPLQWP